jgi:hypothetical protein
VPQASRKAPTASLPASDGSALLAVIGRYLEAEKALEGAVAELEEARAEVVAAFQAAGLRSFHYGPWV